MPWLLRLACVVLLALGISGPAQAQSDIDYDSWSSLANRAEEVIDAGRASDERLEALRREIVSFRTAFQQGQTANAQRIQTLQAQLDALGAVPEAGDPPEIAERRATLEEQLNRLRAPVLRAEEAYTRADGLAREIDSIIRERQADALLELGPSPLNPAYWGRAVEQVATALRSVTGEVGQAWALDSRQAQLRENLPLILILVAFAVALVARGRSVMASIIDRFRSRTRRGTGVWSFLLSLGQILLPVAGLFALSEALSATGMFGVRSDVFVQLLPVLGLIFFALRWLGEQTASDDADIATLPLEDRRRTEVRSYFTVIAVVFVGLMLLNTLYAAHRFDGETIAVLGFPFAVVLGFVLFRLGQILTGLTPASEGEEDSFSFRGRIARLLGRGAMLIGVAGPVMSGVGYANAGGALLVPAISTLILAALVLVLQRFIQDLYQLATGHTAAERDSLIPVLGGFALLLAALPVVALIWGARVADLTELWTQVREGVQLGETRISPTDFLSFVLVFAIGYTLTRLLQSGLRSSVLPKTKIDPGGQTAIVSGLGYVGIFLSALIAISAAGLDLSSLAIVAGALSVGIGFGLQTIVQNFVSGIILLVERPISEGDWVEVGPHMGIVKDISVRATRIETFDRTDVIVPNADFISGTVTNYTRGNTIGRVMVSVGVAYGADTQKVENILLRIARENEWVLLHPEPSVVFARFGADALEFEIRAILRDVNKKLTVLSQMNHEINRRFAEEGIEIPFAQRDIWLRNPEALHPPKGEPT